VGFKFPNRLTMLISLIFIMTLNSCSQKSTLKQTEPDMKVLFIGNSFTFIHGGLDVLLSELTASAAAHKRIRFDSKTMAGATLAIQYELSEVHKTIQEGNYDIVILQGDIPELTEKRVDPFYKYARLFHQEIRDSGAETMFFMTWPYERLNWVGLDEIAEAHARIGLELNAKIAPVGNAFQQAAIQSPKMAMLLDDQEHESIHGFYLAACVIYATLFDENPGELTYAPHGISTDEREFLQGLAWETVQDWRNYLSHRSEIERKP